MKGNLWSKVEYRKYIVDVEQAKIIGAYSHKKIQVKCPYCNREKEIAACSLVRYNFSCPQCSKNISYPELFFISYIEAKGFEYESQVTHDDLTLFYDFKIKLGNEYYYIECNGLQHYEQVRLYNGAKGYGRQKAVDLVKSNYCKEKGYNLIWLDCRESTFDFIKKQISDSSILPNINDEDVENMLKIMELNKRYNVKEIIKLYVEDQKTTREIGKIFGIGYSTVNRILRRNNIKVKTDARGGGHPKRKVRCITTGEVFDSVTDAAREYGLYRTNIQSCLKGTLKTSGKINGEKLQWESV